MSVMRMFYRATVVLGVSKPHINLQLHAALIQNQKDGMADI